MSVPAKISFVTPFIRTTMAVTAVLVGCTYGCATSRTHNVAGKKARHTGAGLKTRELVEGQPVLAPTPKPQNPRPPATQSSSQSPRLGHLALAAVEPSTSTPSSAQIQGCISLTERFVPALQTLFQQLPAGSYYAGTPETANLDLVLAANKSACSAAPSRTALVNAITEVINHHSNRVGVILPLTGDNAQVATFIASGLRAAIADGQGQFDQEVVLKDSSSQTFAARLAELIFKDKVTLIVGGFGHGDAEELVKWSKTLMLPALVLDRDRDLTAGSPYAFMVYPDEKHLADTLATGAIRRGLKRIAILRPAAGKSDKVSNYFKQELTRLGGNVSYELAYTPGNFDSMQGVARQIFKTAAEGREGEYRAAYKKARAEADKEGVPFDARMVVLKPVVDFDAVFIPDDFRTVRHFAKLFKYNMVDHLPLVGNHEWRSPALIDPYDDFFEGSIFADFIGSYSELPPSISAPTVGSPYFTQPQQVVPIDFQLIGYRAGRIAHSALMDFAGGRRQLVSKMQNMSSDAPGYFGRGLIFDAEHHSNWPTYLFSVTKKTLTLEDQPTPAKPAPTVAARSSGVSPLR